MTEGSEAIRPYADSFNRLNALPQAQKPDWMANLRRQAFARFSECGFPAARAEDWKYTPTRSLEKRAFDLRPDDAAHLERKLIEPLLLGPATDVCLLVFIDGHFSAALSETGSPISGLNITSLDDPKAAAPAWAQTLLKSESSWDSDTFKALNTAFLNDGVVIEIEDGVKIDQPLQLLFVSTRQPQPVACHPRILVRLGKHARATLVESWHGLAEAANFSNSYVQIELDEYAELEHLRLQQEGPDEFHVSRVSVSQYAQSRYLVHTLNLGGRWVRNDIYTQLQAPEAETTFNGLYLASGRQHVDNHTRIDHLAPNTRSDELFRGIIDGHAHAVFNGKVLVAKHAQKTDAAQANNNLLLSRTAEIDTKPELEIYADDVKCSHGATIGQLDEQALFYLRSRGIDLESARGILTSAFAFAVLERIAAPALRNYARSHLSSRLPQSTRMDIP